MALFALFRKLYPKQAIYLLSETGFHARVKNTTLSINQVRSPIQLNPQAFAFMGFRWILVRSRGDIFSGRVPYFEFMP